MTACASFEGMPQPVTPAMATEYLTQVAAIQKDIDAAVGEQRKREVRNNAVWAHIRAADAQYVRFVIALNRTGKGSNFGLDLAGVLASSAGAIANGAANELSAAAAALTGARGSINRELYFEKTLPAIESAMQANRIRVKTAIATRLIADNVDRYPLQQALADLNDYQLAPSLNVAIQEITKSAGVAADQAQRRYENAVESCGPSKDVGDNWGRLNDFVWGLADAADGTPAEAGGDKAKKRKALADVHGLMTGKVVSEAMTKTAAEAQIQEIVAAAQKYCTKTSSEQLLAEIATKTGMAP
jgi:hypothetical protein